MEGYYTKQEAARILKVTPRRINQLLTTGRLTRVTYRNRVLIPTEQVDAYYSRPTVKEKTAYEQVAELAARVERLEAEMRATRLSIGFANPQEVRSIDDLRIKRAHWLMLLSKQRYPRTLFADIGDDLRGLREEEIDLLLREVGPRALEPLADLTRRLIEQLKADDPASVVMRQRLTTAQERLLGLVKACVARTEAPVVAERPAVRGPSIETHILAYIQSEYAA